MYDYWLCTIPGVGNRTIEKLQERLGTAMQIYHASEREWEPFLKPKQLKAVLLHKQNWRLQEEYDKMLKKGVQLILQGEHAYPKRLLDIPDAPYGIFVKGHLPVEDNISVAIIGARDCSEYGRYIAEALGKYMGEQGVPVISGMARGIDGISQEAALNAGGTSVAVLGSGVDICYPAQNRTLYEKIQKKGAILSICPPGTLPRAQNFPQRNRIVSGLADVVVVIEARQKSGTLITVDMALEQGKEVYVVPGRVTDRLSDGCNRLLKQGAGLFLSPEEFLTELKEVWGRQRAGGGQAENSKMKSLQTESRRNIGMTVHKESGEKNGESMLVQQDDSTKISPELQPIYAVLDFYPQSMEHLLERLPRDYTVASLNTALMRLCLENQAFQISPGHFCRKKSV